MKIETKLAEQVSFSAVEKAIADYILSHKDEVLHSSVQKLAKDTNSSPGSVMRLCTRIGVSGFREMKIRLAQELNETKTEANIDPDFPFQPNDSAGQVAESIWRVCGQALAETRKRLSMTDVVKACSLISASGITAVFGTGDSFHCAQMFQIRTMRAGYHILITSVHGEQIHLARTLTENDCALLVSYSGETLHTLECARLLKKNRVRTICITAFPESTIARLSTLVLTISAGDTKYHRIASFYSQTAMDYCLNVVYSCMYIRNYEELTHRQID